MTIALHKNDSRFKSDFTEFGVRIENDNQDYVIPALRKTNNDKPLRIYWGDHKGYTTIGGHAGEELSGYNPWLEEAEGVKTEPLMKHTYAKAGDYVISVSNAISAIKFNQGIVKGYTTYYNDSASCVFDVYKYSNEVKKNLNTMPYGSFMGSSISSLDFLGQLSDSLYNLFYACFCNCTNLSDINGLSDVHIGYTESQIFKGCTNIVDVDGFKNSSINLFQHSLFRDCHKLRNVDGLSDCKIITWNYDVFKNCYDLSSVRGLSNCLSGLSFDITKRDNPMWLSKREMNINRMSGTFQNCYKLSSIDGLLRDVLE